MNDEIKKAQEYHRCNPSIPLRDCLRIILEQNRKEQMKLRRFKNGKMAEMTENILNNL